MRASPPGRPSAPGEYSFQDREVVPQAEEEETRLRSPRRIRRTPASRLAGRPAPRRAQARRPPSVAKAKNEDPEARARRDGRREACPPPASQEGSPRARMATSQARVKTRRGSGREPRRIGLRTSRDEPHQGGDQREVASTAPAPQGSALRDPPRLGRARSGSPGNVAEGASASRPPGDEAAARCTPDVSKRDPRLSCGAAGCVGPAGPMCLSFTAASPRG